MRLHLSILILLILSGMSLVPVSARAATSGSLIKSAADRAVYYLVDGKRYAFPNEKVYFSWYADFSNVITVSAAELAGYPLVGNVTYRPGLMLVKIQTDPKTYAVSRYGVLRWVTTEQLAASLYGSTWNKKVHDISDAFFTNYQIGQPITVATDYQAAVELGVTLIAQNIRGAFIPPVAIGTTVSGCQVFPIDNAWNRDVSTLSVHPNSDTYINSIGRTSHVHPNFGENQSYGIPFEIVSGGQQKVPITFTAYGDQSDPGPYPIPADADVEVGGDAHVLVVDKATCKLYELYSANKNATNAGWSADSGAVWDLSTGALRPQGWTSADAAGLPILPGLVRADEVLAGEIKHAIRFTAPRTQQAYILPATHAAGSNNAAYPPMGLRVRLKANYDISSFTGQALVIARALKKYGMILADNGSSWHIDGATDSRWKDDELNQLKIIPGSAFEAVDTGPIVKQTD